MVDSFAQPLSVCEANKLLLALNSLELYPSKICVVMKSKHTEIVVVSTLAEKVIQGWWSNCMNSLLNVLGGSLKPENIILVGPEFNTHNFYRYFIEQQKFVTICNLEKANPELTSEQLRRRFNSNLIRLLTRYYDIYADPKPVQIFPVNLVTALPRT